MPDLILASTSRYRKALLERLGLTFTCEAPRCDEDALKDPTMAPQALAEHLALAKANSVAAEFPQAIVIGSDQVAECDGRILGKPGTSEKAVDQLMLLSGRSHRLITAMVILTSQGRFSHTDLTTLTMRSLDRAALTRYVARDQPIDCAGAYKLEAAGISLFSAIDSRDHSAITGLPLIALSGYLAQLGCQIP